MDWRHHAACRDEDPELFFPIGTSGPAVLQVEQAKAVCRRCSVIDECLQWALESGQDAGVWGGMSEEERRAVKRRGGLRVRAHSLRALNYTRTPRRIQLPGRFGCPPTDTARHQATASSWDTASTRDTRHAASSPATAPARATTSCTSSLTAPSGAATAIAPARRARPQRRRGTAPGGQEIRSHDNPAGAGGRQLGHRLTGRRWRPVA